MKSLVVIPARGGSKTIPRKNLYRVNDVPLIGYAIRAAHTSKTVDRVIVSTDDDEIAEVAMSLGAEVPFMRPGELADDEVSIIPVIQHAAKSMARDKGFDADIVISLQPTAPLLKPDSIDACIDLMHSSNCSSTIIRILR